ncbi:MbtH family protein [Kitasatospora sp. NBC_01266]|uniref:MbtH family protein n=1 Tax=Kitasatospora sp. NBC_01266 TaxID=2903572 RepID=UPI002E30C40F|nr:MbtH family protein [Kitasatospora sp. NBC_01266]
MTDDPFNDPAGRYRVLVNDAGDHSLWPAFAAIPAGWSVTLDEASRPECVEHINRNWTAAHTTARVTSNV